MQENLHQIDVLSINLFIAISLHRYRMKTIEKNSKRAIFLRLFPLSLYLHVVMVREKGFLAPIDICIREK